MTAKPFLAARIPADLDAALTEHCKTTGETRTAAVVNALEDYLLILVDRNERFGARERMESLEQKVAELEQKLELIGSAGDDVGQISLPLLM